MRARGKGQSGVAARGQQLGRVWRLLASACQTHVCQSATSGAARASRAQHSIVVQHPGGAAGSSSQRQSTAHCSAAVHSCIAAAGGAAAAGAAAHLVGGVVAVGLLAVGGPQPRALAHGGKHCDVAAAVRCHAARVNAVHLWDQSGRVESRAQGGRVSLWRSRPAARQSSEAMQRASHAHAHPVLQPQNTASTESSAPCSVVVGCA